ncbi:cysteine hydrolase [Nocardioides sp. AN3]
MSSTSIREMSLDPAETAIIAIDIQNGFCSPKGTMAQAGGDISMMAATVPHIRRLVEAGRGRGVLDVWTKQEHYADDVTKQRHQITPHTMRWAAGPTGLKGTWDSDFIDDVGDLVTEPAEIVVKHRFSGFFDTRLDTLLRMKGVRTLIVTGVATAHCVETTVRDGYQRDYDIIVPREAVGTLTIEPHEASLWMIDRFFGKVLPTDDVLRLIAGETLTVDYEQGFIRSQAG